MKKVVGRYWGHYTVLHEGADYVVKELVINPGCGISYQRHENRDEFWFVRKGVVGIRQAPFYGPYAYIDVRRKTGESFIIHAGSWHQAYNDGNKPVVLLEMQAGQCSEEDIVRLWNYGEENGKER
jgi:mannose-6-phosphate isomerase-like protein (cupin superfamily)